MNESNEELPNMVTPPPSPSRHSPNSYSVISVSEINFVIPEVFEFYGKNKLEVAMAKYLEPSTHDREVNEELRSLFNCLARSTS